MGKPSILHAKFACKTIKKSYVFQFSFYIWRINSFYRIKKKTLRMKISIIRKSINFEKSICIYMVFYFLRKKGGISLANFMNKYRILGFVYCGFWMYILHMNFMVFPCTSSKMWREKNGIKNFLVVMQTTLLFTLLHFQFCRKNIENI